MGATKSKHSTHQPNTQHQAQHISRPQTQSYQRQAQHGTNVHTQLDHASYGYVHQVGEEEIHKGLHNEISAYHCFINVIIQSLWHLNSWRRRFEALDFNHTHRSDPCIFCALRSIFVAFQYSDSTIIPPDQLRQALSDGDLRLARDRFQVGSMGDAEEALDFILRWLHSEQVTPANKDVSDQDFHADLPCSPPCISHTVFGGTFMDCCVCQKCHAVGDPSPTNSFLYRVYAGELLSQLSDNNADTAPLSFESRLRKLYTSTTYSCPNEQESHCKGPSFIDRWLLQVPLVFCIMFVWPAEVSREDISLLWSILPQDLCLNQFLRTHTNVPDLPAYVLRGVVGFYGQHYMAFFWSITHKAWLMFDDRRVVIVGDWFDLCDKVTLGKIRPILAFFETTQDIGSLSDNRTLAASMASNSVRSPIPVSSAASSVSPTTTVLPPLHVSDVFGDLPVMDYATPRETQTQIVAGTSRR